MPAARTTKKRGLAEYLSPKLAPASAPPTASHQGESWTARTQAQVTSAMHSASVEFTIALWASRAAR